MISPDLVQHLLKTAQPSNGAEHAVTEAAVMPHVVAHVGPHGQINHVQLVDTYVSKTPSLPVGTESNAPPPLSTTTTTVGTGGETGNSLPFTGADIAELAVIGVGAVAAGRLLLVRHRRNAS